jgi:hypothetical protein
MSEIHLYTKISSLPDNLKKEVEDFVDFIVSKGARKNLQNKKRKLGLAKGLIKLKDNFDDPIEAFNAYG